VPLRNCSLSHCLWVTQSTKSTNFGSRYLKQDFQNGVKFEKLIEGTLLYITTQIDELWPKRSPLWGAKIVKCVTKICNAFLVDRLAERDEISHDDGHWCVEQVIYSQLFRQHKFSTANISHTFSRSSTKLAWLGVLTTDTCSPNLANFDRESRDTMRRHA